MEYHLAGFQSRGFEGDLVTLEIAHLPGVPSWEILGNPGPSAFEARDRVRFALQNNGYTLPKGRRVFNLQPPDLKKRGDGLELPFLVASLVATRGNSKLQGLRICAHGQVNLDGSFSALGSQSLAWKTAGSAGYDLFIGCPSDGPEVDGQGAMESLWVDSIDTLAEKLCNLSLKKGRKKQIKEVVQKSRGQELEWDQDRAETLWGSMATNVKRSFLLAALSRAHCLLLGPPGTGKTTATELIPYLWPGTDRNHDSSITQLYQLAALAPPPLETIHVVQPHHSSSTEGLVGGGNPIRPGALSLAHGGVLVLDEMGEFKGSALQQLRVPMGQGQVTLNRAGVSAWFPAQFQLMGTTNLCPCGMSGGSDEQSCSCTPGVRNRYWTRFGGPLLDRIALRIPMVHRDGTVTCRLNSYPSLADSRAVIGELRNGGPRDISPGSVKKLLTSSMVSWLESLSLRRRESFYTLVSWALGLWSLDRAVMVVFESMRWGDSMDHWPRGPDREYWN